MRTRVRAFSRRFCLFGITALLAVIPAEGRAQEEGRLEPSLVRTDAGPRGGRTVFSSGRYLTEGSAAHPEAIVLGYVREHLADFGLSDEEGSGLYVVKSQVTPHDRVGRVVLGQRIDGIRVYPALLVGTVDRQGRLVMVSGRTAAAHTSGSLRLSPGMAIAMAAGGAGAGPVRMPSQSAPSSGGRYSYANPYARGVIDPEPVSAELVWFMMGDQVRLSWLTDVELGPSAWYGTVIDADTGAVLEREDRYKSSGPDGDVFTTQHPDAPGAARTRQVFSGVNGSWVTGTTTSGNNVNAYRDLNDSDANDEYQPTNADQHFRYAFTNAWRGLPDGTDLADLDATTIDTALDADLDAIITQLFYYTNDMHDWLWGFGFDEASGNFQVANPSGNGVAGDPVLAEAQDGFDFACAGANRCLNNANFGTNGDGSAARMQMFMWARPNRPYRDGSVDGDVIAHEYGHGVSNRLVPGTLSGATDQAGSLGEGWSDAISFLRWGDATVAEYVTGNAASGIRTFGYAGHPWTYGNYSTSVTSPHRNGEIWGATLYDVRLLLGINLTTQLVLDGMRSTGNGPSPTFLDARDGILANDQAANGGANRCALWAAFAGRGMGTGAVSNGLHAVPTQDFTLPAECRPTANAGGPYSTPEGTDVVVTGAASTKGSHTSAGDLVSFQWDFDNDGQYDDAAVVSPAFDLVGQDGAFTVGLQVTDEWGLTATATATVTVTNVTPTVTINAITPINELGTVTVSGTVTDPGWLETLTATIDFDDGAGPQPLPGVLENARPNATLSFSVNKQYGDNGSFVVTVAGLDDDSTASTSRNAVVVNVNPTVTIDPGGEQVYDGVSAFVVEAGDTLTIPAGSTDPGSDDITLTWDWNDGTTTVQMSLVNPPNLDPPKSPSIQPRVVALSADHVFGQACLYQLTVGATDDDGGSASDSAAVIITGNATESMGMGWWLNQYRVKSSNDFTPAQLDCYLEIVRFFSLVFNASHPADRAGAATIMHAPPKSPANVIFDQHALAAWLNFANGSVKLSSPVDTDGDGVQDSTWGAAMLAAETVRMNPASTSDEIKDQKDIVERITTQSGS